MPRKLKNPLEQMPLEPRKVPGQARSRKRVDLILDAATEVLVEQGFDGVTTNLIAQRAEVSIGSVYQFFPNKFSILYALALRHLDRIAEVRRVAVSPENPISTWEEGIDRVIDALAGYWVSQKALPILWQGIRNAPDLLEAVGKSQEKAGEENMELLNYVLPHVDPLRRRLIAQVMVRLSETLLSLSITDAAEQGPYVVEELKLLMKAYIREHVAADVQLPEAVGRV